MGQADGETVRAMRQIDWKDALPRVVLYTAKILERLTWLGVLGGPPIAGLTADDIVQEGIANILSGRRVWKKNKPILHFLMEDVIRSIISNKVRSVENRITGRIEQHVDKDNINQRTNGKDISKILDKSFSKGLDNEAIKGWFDKEREYIIKSLEHDELLCKIAILIVDDNIEKPNAIARILGVEVTDINNAKKRLKRWLRKEIANKS